MNSKRQKLVEVLREAHQFLSRPDNHFAWSSWEDAPAALREIDGIIARIESDDMPKRSDIELLFLPTGPIQEVSVSSGWGQEFVELASRFDTAIARAYGEDVFAQLGRLLPESWRPKLCVRSCMQSPRFAKSKVVRVVAAVVAGYVSVYFMLSLAGSYRPLAFTGGGTVREYQVWAPAGFYDPTPSPYVGVWRRSFVSLSFYPLWCVDMRLIHRTKGPNERSGVDAGADFAAERMGVFILGSDSRTQAALEAALAIFHDEG